MRSKCLWGRKHTKVNIKSQNDLQFDQIVYLWSVAARSEPVASLVFFFLVLAF